MYNDYIFGFSNLEIFLKLIIIVLIIMLLKFGRLVHQQSFAFAEGTTTIKVNLHAPHLQKYFNNDISQVTT